MHYDAYETELLPLSQLYAHTRNELIAFARERCPNMPQGYIEKRFCVYDFVLISRYEESVQAWMFVNTFDRSDADYIYLGPLFSRASAFLPMFIAGLDRLWSTSAARQLYLLTEFQSPGLFLLFKSLFADCSWPEICGPAIPQYILQAAQQFVKQLSHISGFNSKNFSSTSGETLYAGGSSFPHVMHWMHTRGVFPERGDNQLLLAFVAAQQREELLLQLRTAVAHPLKRKQQQQMISECFKLHPRDVA